MDSKVAVVVRAAVAAVVVNAVVEGIVLGNSDVSASICVVVFAEVCFVDETVVFIAVFGFAAVDFIAVVSLVVSNVIVVDVVVAAVFVSFEVWGGNEVVTASVEVTSLVSVMIPLLAGVGFLGAFSN